MLNQRYGRFRSQNITFTVIRLVVRGRFRNNIRSADYTLVVTRAFRGNVTQEDEARIRWAYSGRRLASCDSLVIVYDDCPPGRTAATAWSTKKAVA